MTPFSEEKLLQVQENKVSGNIVVSIVVVTSVREHLQYDDVNDPCVHLNNIFLFWLARTLCLSAAYEQVAVNVLNETVETFDSMPVSMNLESCDGNVKLPLKALTCLRGVTGNYKAVDLSKFQDQWPH